MADVLTARTVTACRDHGVGTLVIVSGVAANARLRELAAQRCRYGNPPADTAAAVVY